MIPSKDNSTNNTFSIETDRRRTETTIIRTRTSLTTEPTKKYEDGLIPGSTTGTVSRTNAIDTGILASSSNVILMVWFSLVTKFIPSKITPIILHLRQQQGLLLLQQQRQQQLGRQSNSVSRWFRTLVYDLISPGTIPGRWRWWYNCTSGDRNPIIQCDEEDGEQQQQQQQQKPTIVLSKLSLLLSNRFPYYCNNYNNSSTLFPSASSEIFSDCNNKQYYNKNKYNNNFLPSNNRIHHQYQPLYNNLVYFQTQQQQQQQQQQNNRIIHQQQRSINFPSFFFRGGSNNKNKKKKPKNTVAAPDDSYTPADEYREQHSHDNESDYYDDTVTTKDVSKLHPYSTTLSSANYPISVCSIQGYRSYMEDSFVSKKDFVAVFDGHGGKDVSTYLRSSIYAMVQKQLQIVVRETAHDPTTVRYVQQKLQYIQQYQFYPQILLNPTEYNLLNEISEDSYANFAGTVLHRTIPNINNNTNNTKSNGDASKLPGSTSRFSSRHPNSNNPSSRTIDSMKIGNHPGLSRVLAAEEEIDTVDAQEQRRRRREEIKRRDEQIRMSNDPIVVLDDKTTFPAAPSVASAVLEHPATATVVVPGGGSTTIASSSGTAAPTGSSELSITAAATTTTTTTTTIIKELPPTVDEYEMALRKALKKCDHDILRIKHWSHQGSTALCCWIHEDNLIENNSSTTTTTATTAKTDSKSSSHPFEDNIRRTLVIANIGDSRAVLSREGIAYDLTRDHKPNDPIERQHIYDNGGQVLWHGDFDNRTGQPMEGTGLYRVNGNLALSRVIGDRTERPAVRSDPDITKLTVNPTYDDFLILATDGLWDVMSSTDVVAYVHALLDEYYTTDDDDYNKEYIYYQQPTNASNSTSAENTTSTAGGNKMDDTIACYDDDTMGYHRDEIVPMIVEEALRRGSYDNITVVIVWIGGKARRRRKRVVSSQQQQQQQQQNNSTTSSTLSDELPFP